MSNYDLAIRVIVVSAIGASIMKIFGNKGILITFLILGLLLLAIYLFQNKLLYMPSTVHISQASLIYPFPPRKTPRTTVIPQNMDLRRRTSR